MLEIFTLAKHSKVPLYSKEGKTVSTEIVYQQQEQCICQDEFRQILHAFGLTLLRHRPVYTDPFVLKQRWLTTPTGKQYHERAFYEAFDHRTFRHALSFLVAHSSYTLDQLALLGLSLKQFIFLEEQEFLVKAPSWCIEESHVLGFTLTNTKKMCWNKGMANQRISDIGHTLEWYVAEWFRHKYHALARHGVEIKELTAGGDLDVVALKDGKRILVECKSSSQIPEQKLRLFLQRSADFQPNLALLLIDTESPKSVEVRTQILCHLLNEPYDPTRKQLHGKTVFRWIPTHNIYVANTGAGIDATLGAVLRFHDALALFRIYR